ncbi:MAG: hypothetical protein AAFU80_00355 [Pseudomonadota bacterium]
MNTEFALRRRLLVVAQTRYAQADAAWAAAAEAALSWFPAESRPAVPPIGDPGSALRRLWEERERALRRFAAARLRMDRARARALRLRRRLPARPILLIAAR